MGKGTRDLVNEVSVVVEESMNEHNLLDFLLTTILLP